MHIGGRGGDKKRVALVWSHHGLILHGAEHWQLAGARAKWSQRKEQVSTLLQ